MLRKLVAATALAGVLLVPTAGAAFAHECVIASRSDQGDAMAASHAKTWGTLTLTDIFGFILPDALQQPSLSPSQLEWAIATAEAQGIPYSFTTRTDKTIGEGSANPNLADGRGLDHLVDVYGDQVAGIYFSAEQQP